MVLGAVPKGPCHPYKIAKWFLQLDTNDITEALPGRKYRANPIIVSFFRQATDMSEKYLKGDETWWCAAFVNWCLYQANQSRTNKAASSSFREWNTIKPERARVGDIIVYQSTSDVRFGHVGFFVSKVGKNKFLVLGGNQTIGGRQMICEQSYPRNSDSQLTFHSFARDPNWPAI
jgi:uncharacterized protein (TIGR02594 family)